MASLSCQAARVRAHPGCDKCRARLLARYHYSELPNYSPTCQYVVICWLLILAPDYDRCCEVCNIHCPALRSLICSYHVGVWENGSWKSSVFFVFVTGSKPQIDKRNCERAWFRGANVWVSQTTERTQKNLTKSRPSQNLSQKKRNSNSSGMPARATRRRNNQRELARIPPKARGGPLEQRSTAT